MSRLLQKTGWLVCAILMLPPFAGLYGPTLWALDAEIRGFHHVAWTSENGLGAVFDIQQAHDGYLWLTTSRGVFRFDGVRFQSVEEVTNGAAHNDEIFSVFLASSGDVWLSTRNAGLLLWKDLRLIRFPDRRCSPASQMGGVVEGRDGSLWIQGSAGLFHLRESVCEQVGPEHGYPGGFPAGILVDHEGNVWVKAASGALLVRPKGQSNFLRTPYADDPTSGSVFLHESHDGSIWISDKDGLRRLPKEISTSTSLSPRIKSRTADAPFRDFTFEVDGSLWAVTSTGITRFEHAEQLPIPLINEGAMGESFTPQQGLSSDAVWKVLVDAEGTVWVATNSGLDRLRRTPLSTIALPHSQEHEFAVAAGDRGSVWTGNSALSLTHIAANGSTTTFPEIAHIICIRRDRSGTIWVAGESHLWKSSSTGFSVLHYPDEKVAPIASIAVDQNNNLWISVPGSGTYQFLDNKWVNQNVALGKQPRTLGAMAGDDAGNVWFGFSNKLVKWDGSGFKRFSFPDGAFNVSVGTMAVRGDHVWLAGRGGVDLFANGHFYLMRWKNPDLPGRVSGIVETKTGDLWINGFSGITHVSADDLTKWLRDPLSAVSAEHLNALDGLPGFSGERLPEPSVVESAEGPLWFATTKGIARLDPAMLQRNRNRMMPPVAIESIFANGKTYRDSHDLTFPARTQNLQINYTALSLAIPERVQFRYKLEGIDNEWQDAGTRRQAFYNNLPPGRYRFRIIASNNDGVWNESGASVGVFLAPAFYQTWWFRGILGLVAVCVLWWLVRLRISSVTRQLQERLGERLAERERIARELHDTLLQSLFGLMLRFQSAADRLPNGDPTRKALDEALNQSEAVMREGRERVRNLRSTHTECFSLIDVLTAVGHQLQTIHPAEFRIFVEGQPRSLDALVQEEIVLIGREAITNAFTHSGGQIIVVEVSYNPDNLHLRVYDDGCGIEDEVLKAGRRSDHWGLIGMKERSVKIQGELCIGRRRDGGTQIDLRIPSAIAYLAEQSEGGRLRGIFRRNREASRFAVDSTPNNQPLPER
jgi:signal transduction histidine kinase/ligand-binding sensor domain-containing protein